VTISFISEGIGSVTPNLQHNITHNHTFPDARLPRTNERSNERTNVSYTTRKDVGKPPITPISSRKQGQQYKSMPTYTSTPFNGGNGPLHLFSPDLSPIRTKDILEKNQMDNNADDSFRITPIRAALRNHASDDRNSMQNTSQEHSNSSNSSLFNSSSIDHGESTTQYQPPAKTIYRGYPSESPPSVQGMRYQQTAALGSLIYSDEEEDSDGGAQGHALHYSNISLEDEKMLSIPAMSEEPIFDNHSANNNIRYDRSVSTPARNNKLQTNDYYHVRGEQSQIHQIGEFGDESAIYDRGSVAAMDYNASLYSISMLDGLPSQYSTTSLPHEANNSSFHGNRPNYYPQENGIQIFISYKC
jgi:hypothetical protein